MGMGIEMSSPRQPWLMIHCCWRAHRPKYLAGVYILLVDDMTIPARTSSAFSVSFSYDRPFSWSFSSIKSNLYIQLCVPNIMVAHKEKKSNKRIIAAYASALTKSARRLNFCSNLSVLLRNTTLGRDYQKTTEKTLQLICPKTYENRYILMDTPFSSLSWFSSEQISTNLLCRVVPASVLVIPHRSLY